MVNSFTYTLVKMIVVIINSFSKGRLGRLKIKLNIPCFPHLQRQYSDQTDLSLQHHPQV